MNDLIINVEKSTRMVLMTKTTVGNDMENLQEKIIFKFTDTFVDGQARLEYKIGSTKNYIELTKENNTYILPIQNVLTKEGKIEMQLVITEGESEENISVFKSNVFYLYCNRSLNAVSESPEGYDLWIEQANAKLNAMDEALTEVDNLDIDASKIGDTATISITNKEGTTKTVQVKDGIDGQQGETGPANTLSIGTVTKGENANATITGESPNQTLNLVLPKGDKGDKGNTGATGNDGYSPSAKVTQLSGGATITITDKSGTTTATITSGEQGPEGPAGKDGKDGADAKINGVNALNIEAGTNISLDQQGSTLTINATGGTSDYTPLTNKPKINNVELNGNKTSSDLGLITNAVDDLVNYYKKSETFTKQEVNNLITAITTMDIQVVQTLPTEDISTTTIYLVPKTTAETNDAYDEYIYVSNAWEHIGSTEVDLTNYVTNTDYATSQKGGVIKCFNSDGLNINNGTLIAATKTYAQYNSGGNWMFVGKGTLENVITGKGLIDNTYHDSSKQDTLVSGTNIKTINGNSILGEGNLVIEGGSGGSVNWGSIGGTLSNQTDLSNILATKVSNTDYATPSVGGVIKVTNGDHGITIDEGVLKGTVRTLAQYNDMSSKGLVCKGTLENVLDDRIGDIDTILTRLTTGGGVS